MNKQKISTIEVCSILIAIMIASFLGTGIFSVIKKSGIDAYISVAIAGIVGAFLIALYLYIANYKPELPFNEKINSLFGKKMGFILNILLTLSVFAMGITAMFNLTNFIVSQFLSETPILIIGLLFSIIIIYINIKGIETISRVSFLLIIFNIILFLTAVLGLSPQIDFNNLKPFLEYGITRPLEGSIYPIFINILPIFLLLIIPKKNISDQQKYSKYIYFCYFLAIFFMLAILIVTLGNLGIHLASIYQYPEYIVLKRINLFNFLDRIENIVTIQWLFGLFIVMSIIVYYVSENIKIKKFNNLKISIIMLSILFASHFIFKNNTIFNNYIYNYTLYTRLVAFIIIIIVSITIFIKKILSNDQ